MLIETIELTIGQLGLDDLTEFHLMKLFADTHSHRLVVGTGNSLSGIVDNKDRQLYPANYLTHLTVPPDRLLGRHRLWDRVSVGVDIKTTAHALLDGHYVLGKAGELPEDPAMWDPARFPTMIGGAMFVVDGVQGQSQLSVPIRKTIADLPNVSRPPASMEKFRQVLAQGTIDPAFEGNLSSPEPIRYEVVGGRDAAVGYNKHLAMVFAGYVQVMDHAERVLLASQWPPVPSVMIAALSVLERETCYVENCRAGDTIVTQIRGRIEDCPQDFHGSARDVVSGGILTTAMELYREHDGALLVASKAKKLFAFSQAQSGPVKDAKRVTSRFRVAR